MARERKKCYKWEKSCNAIARFFTRSLTVQKGMAWCSQSVVKNKFPTKNSLLRKIIIQNWRRDKQKLNESTTTKPALQEMLKRLLQAEEKRLLLETWKLQKEHSHWQRQMCSKDSRSTDYKAGREFKSQQQQNHLYPQ